MREYFLGRLSGCQKRVFKKKCTLFVFVCFMLEKEKEKNEKHGKRKCKKKKQTNSVFWVLVNTEDVFCRNGIFEKLANTICVRKVKKNRAFSLQLSVFGKWSFFWCPFKVTKHYNNRGFSRHRGNPKWHFWLQKCHLGKGPRKGVYYL